MPFVHLLLTVCALAATVPLLAQSELVIVKQGTSEYHRPGCEVVKDGKGVLAMTRAQAEARKLTSHPVCDPSNAPESASATAGASKESSAASTKAATDFVYVDAAAKSKYYHRAKCARLGEKEKKIALEQAGRKYWPCPVCKPPIRKRPAK